jgi:uncharacterized protein
MNYKDYLQQPTKYKAFCGFLLFIYVINDRLFRNTKWEEKLWGYLRLEIFYLGGQCQHSGQCCKTLMIYKKEKPVNTKEDFESLTQKEPEYRRFIPHLKEKKVHHYTCKCLTPQNWCRDYENRPSICKNYPLSNFLRGDTLYQGCGYKIEKTDFPFKITNKTLLNRIQNYEFTHKRTAPDKRQQNDF